jgi:putative DNA primase/helicase
MSNQEDVGKEAQDVAEGILKLLSRQQDTEREFKDTDMSNAARLAARHGQDLHCTPEVGWVVWDGARWRTDEMGAETQRRAKDTSKSIYDEVKDSPKANRGAVLKHARNSQKKSAIEAMIKLTLSEPGIDTRLCEEDSGEPVFDAHPMLFNLTNGTLDLTTGALREHSRKDLITKIARVKFNPAAECELWLKFLRRITKEDEELVAYLQRLVGYSLTGDVSEKCLIFLYGASGDNGKTVFCETWLSLLGGYGAVSSPDLILQRSKYPTIPNDVARLRGVRAAIMNETPQGSRFDETKLKDLTGGDKLSARFLHREYFQFPPTHKLIIRGNHKPGIRGTDDAIWNRLRTIPFEVQIPKEEQDRQLKQKLQAELPGILNWALRGCADWRRMGLAAPSRVMDAVKLYRQESDTVARFVSEECERAPNALAPALGFFSRYKDFCEAVGEMWLTIKEVAAEMERKGYRTQRKKEGNFYVGLKLRDANRALQQAPDRRQGFDM